MAHDVFISYAHEDRAIADMVCARAEAQGVRCWIAPRDITAGADWGGAIMAAIRASKLMVLVFSTSANKSKHVPRELERAIDLSIPVIPFRIEDIVPGGALEYGLSSVHWVDAIAPPIEPHVSRLADTLSSMLGAGSAPRPVPRDPDVGSSPLAQPQAAARTPSPARRARRSSSMALVIGVALLALIGATYFYWTSAGHSVAATAANSTPSITTASPSVASAPPPVTTASPAASPAASPGSPAAPAPTTVPPAASVNTAATKPSVPARPTSTAPGPTDRAINSAESQASSRKAPKDPATAERCHRLLESASLGETLTAADKTFLGRECRE